MTINTRELQMKLLEMMKQFHEICEHNNLRYYILGGTCLGAVRHKGFIPWDDDMDIGMPRKDFEQFCDHASVFLPDELELRFYRNTANSPFHYAKLINKNTTLIEPKYHNYVEGIYIDLFPLDNMADHSIWNRIRVQRIWFKHAIIMNHCSTEQKKGFARKLFQFYSKQRNLEKLHTSIDELMRADENKESHLLCNFLGAWKDREILPAEVYGEPRLYIFEDTKLYGPTDSDSYLKSLYGDYMTPPPEDKRVCRHDYYYVSFDIAYKDFIRKGRDIIN